MSQGSLVGITLLRGLAALMVFFFHQRSRLEPGVIGTFLDQAVFRSGYLGVDLFFILSGFVLGLSTERRQTPKNFWVRRFFRIWPCLGLSLALMALTRPIEGAALIKGLLLIPLDPDARPPWFGYGFNPSIWTLSYEAYFYLMFGLALWLSPQRRTGVAALLVGIPFALIQGLDGGSLEFWNPYRALSEPLTGAWGLLSLPGNPMVLEFLLGLLAYRLFPLLKDPGPILRWISLGLIGLFIFAYGFFLRPGHGPFQGGLWSFLLVLGILGLESFLLRGPLLFKSMGQISYSFYLLSIPLHEVYLQTIPWIARGPGLAAILSECLLTGLISAMTYHFFEKPWMDRGRLLGDWLDERRQRGGKSEERRWGSY